MNLHNRTGFSLVATLLLLGTLGCGGKNHKVEGIVTLDGKPLASATVTFLPEDEDGIPATGHTGEDGKFRLVNQFGAGCRAGEYKLLVTASTTPQLAGEYPTGEQLAGADGQKMLIDMQKMVRKAMEAQKPKDKNLIPRLYSNVKTTPLRCKVPLEQPLQIDLTSKSK